MEDVREQTLSTSPTNATIHPRLTPNILQPNEVKIDPPLTSKNDVIYKPLSYLYNYIPIRHDSNEDTFSHKTYERENEFLLKKYYSLRVSSVTVNNPNMSSKLSSNDTSLRQNSVTSTSDISDITKVDRNALHDIINCFLSTRSSDFLQGADNQVENLLKDEMNCLVTPLKKIGDSIYESNCISPYFQYIKKFEAINAKQENDAVSKHTLWMPITKDYVNPYLLHPPMDNNLYANKTSPLFIQGLNVFNNTIDTFRGITNITSIFGEQKLPALVYHSASSCGDNIYIFGGLMACNMYDQNAPDLSDFRVDGLENLPPPLIPKIVNNPAMINNPHLYCLSNISKSLKRPKVCGQIPPPLCCAKMSNITERHLFIYGGFEIKSDTVLDSNGIYHIRKRLYANEFGYILDVETFKFSKIEIIAQSYNDILYPTISGRFGQVQMAVNLASVVNTGNSTPSVSRKTTLDIHSDISKSSDVNNIDDKSSSKTGSHQIIISTVYVFGGYRETAEGTFEALGDFWRIELSVEARGKRGYLKFNESAQAVRIYNEDNLEWPSARAFSASSYVDLAVNEVIDMKKLENELCETLDNQLKSNNKNDAAPVSLTRPSLRSSRSSHKNCNRNNNINTESQNEQSSRMDNIDSDNKLFNQYYKMHKDKFKNNNEYFVVQGGSDNHKVLGDLWFFNTVTERWNCKDIRIQRKSDHKFIPLNLPLVGHTLVTEGDIGISIGGLSQAAVDYLYDRNVSGRDEDERSSNLSRVIGSSMVNSYNLRSGNLQLQKVEKAKYPGYGDYQLVDNKSDGVSTTALHLGCTIVKIRGILYIIGGVVSANRDYMNLHIKGAIESIITPSVNLFS
ncbi:hypothetical protein TPHA_0N00210 [Tetrapisispora phaffii CBS 4417]|uniref:Uncharacterized protein n=1 Tax=Tetrapisispora phaffii (strain ATCC 24235 / CBS 4417 / NBRC 1672 / NRRL Y-8282 / UCD 70-5) TaxID=1071381 RepID=G8C0X4_TETPH|nr:hypothetical protein TPHA_0N00210 [Tetrapisispora phaffii CBS 4417]CCE65802.1 hypothetical protein TPHA_0N00210 [Tetrapisispora phaffii CBS 4417]